MAVLLTMAAAAFVRGDDEIRFIPEREYRFVFGGLQDLNSVARIGVNLYALMTDAYYLGLSPDIPPKLEPFTGVVMQTIASFGMTIWPHEFGHWTRAREIGGEFVFEKLTFPWPKARMDLPEDVSLISETMTSVGGFEINNLMRRQIISDFYSHDHSYANLMVHAFIQEIYFRPMCSLSLRSSAVPGSTPKIR